MFQSIDLGTKKLLLFFLSLLFFWWVLSAAGICSASGTYTITEAELNQLDNNLNKLEQVSATQKRELTLLKDTLQQAQNQLSISKEQLAQAQTSLQIANESLQKYAAEEKRTRLRIKAQRNTWIAIASCLLVALVVK